MGAAAPDFLKEADKPAHRPLVLITSGGTTVPPEENTVCVIDNISSGGRGAGLAQAILAEECNVIFLD